MSRKYLAQESDPLIWRADVVGGAQQRTMHSRRQGGESMNIETDERYAWWRLALEGRAPQAVIDDPQCGYYSRGKGEKREPVAITPECAFLGFDQAMVDTVEIWPSVYSHPVTDEAYWEAIDNRRWSDLEGIVAAKPVEDPAAVPFGSNQPADVDPLAAITEEVDAAIRQLELVLPKPGEVVKDKETADKIANSKDRLRELWSRADGQRKVEKAPHDEAAAAVQARWKPLVEARFGRIAAAGEKAETALAAHLQWARAEQRRIEQEREAARLAEERRRQEEHAKALAEAEEKGEPEPEPPAPVAAPPPPEPTRVGGGLSGRKTGLKKSNYRARIDDYPKALESLKDNPKVREAVQACADALARSAAHIAAPGCTVLYDEVST